MDPFWLAIGIFTLLIILAVLKKAFITPGQVGESKVAWRLSWLPKDEYFIINDLLFHVNKDHTTQIDHVVVSPYGIFVIETKNHTGYIYGGENSPNWKKYWKAWYRGIEHSDELTFQNPILQNEAHVEALKKVLVKFDIDSFISIIAFSPKAELKVQVNNANLMYWTQVRRFIRHFDNPVMSIDEAKQIYDYLLAINVCGKDARVKHATRALLNRNTYQQNADIALAQGKCPKCGGDLIKRIGTYGAFYGCSNYPNCKYTHPTV